MKALAVWFLFSASAADIPKTWDKAAIESLQLPLAMREFSPSHISAEDYYRIPERIIYRSYPVYAPGREPAGYEGWLTNVEPVVAFDAGRLTSPEDWIAAGETVFNAPSSFGPVFFTAQDVRDPEFIRSTAMPVAADGSIPFARWVVRRKGVVELGSMGCATCHTRVLPDGTIVPGAQGNNPNDRQGALLLRRSAASDAAAALQRVRAFASQFEAPWLREDLNRLPRSLKLDQIIAAGEAIPPGVTARANTSMILPPQIPDLIGVRERRFLDHTGIVRQRDIGDLMRYTSLAQDLFAAERYGSAPVPRRVPAARYSDAQLYALAMYLYSLRPPPNPNRLDSSAARGKRLFEQQRCVECHTPPLFTNNKLVAVDGFVQPEASDDVSSLRIGVDGRYALETRKGTGFYKVPSLKGVWYRGPFGHNGSAATLDDWLDPARLHPDYVPTGFKGYNGQTRSIPGHPFGLQLPAAARRDLIAYLKTL
jgi:hypothetical protein